MENYNNQLKQNCYSSGPSGMKVRVTSPGTASRAEEVSAQGKGNTEGVVEEVTVSIGYNQMVCCRNKDCNSYGCYYFIFI